MTIQYSQKNTVTEPILISISQDVSIISVTEIIDEVNRYVINLSLMKNMKRVGNKLYQGTIHCIPHQMHILMHNDYYRRTSSLLSPITYVASYKVSCAHRLQKSNIINITAPIRFCNLLGILFNFITR